jgi:integrase/recombinase XerD
MAGIYADHMVMQHESILMRKTAIAGEDKVLIKNFVNSKTTEAGISQNRANKFTRILGLIATRYLNGTRFTDLDKDEIIRVLAEIERSELKAWTKHDYKLVLRMFLEWLGKDVSWIKVRNPRNDLQAEDMLTDAEVHAMIDAAASLRDKALVATLYDGGFRIAELGELRIKDVAFDSYGAILIVRGKTGIRRVRIISAAPYLSQWLNAHPLRTNREAPLWISSTNNEIMNYFALRAQLQKIAKRAGITKKVNPHNFRHSRATYLASHLTESQLEEYLGWVHGSASPRTYVHLSGRDVDDKILELHGLKKETEASEATVKQCPFCKTLNTVDAMVCHICKRPLEIRAEDVISLEDQIKSLKEQSEAQQRELTAMKEREKEHGDVDSIIDAMFGRLETDAAMKQRMIKFLSSNKLYSNEKQ